MDSLEDLLGQLEDDLDAAGIATRARRRKAPSEHKQCAQCDATFQPNYKDQKFCGRECFHRSTIAGTSLLAERRVAAGLKQTDLAALAQCSCASVRLFEAGYRPEASPALDRVEAVLSERGF